MVVEANRSTGSRTVNHADVTGSITECKEMLADSLNIFQVGTRN